MSCSESYLLFVIYICSGHLSDSGLHPPACLASVYNSLPVDWRNCDLLSCRPGLCETGRPAPESVYADHYTLSKTSTR